MSQTATHTALILIENTSGFSNNRFLPFCSKATEHFMSGSVASTIWPPFHLDPRKARSTLMFIVASLMKPWGAFGAPGALPKPIATKGRPCKRNQYALGTPSPTSSCLLTTLWSCSVSRPPVPLVSGSRKRFKKSVRCHDIRRMFDRGRSQRIMT